MSFSLQAESSVLQLWAAPEKSRSGFRVLVCLGNGATYNRAIQGWPESPAHAADWVVCVKESSDVHALYERGSADPESSRDWTATQTAHTALAVAGLSRKLRDARGPPWIIACASGGCATAVALARELLGFGEEAVQH